MYVYIYIYIYMKKRRRRISQSGHRAYIYTDTYISLYMYMSGEKEAPTCLLGAPCMPPVYYTMINRYACLLYYEHIVYYTKGTMSTYYTKSTLVYYTVINRYALCVIRDWPYTGIPESGREREGEECRPTAARLRPLSILYMFRPSC